MVQRFVVLAFFLASLPAWSQADTTGSSFAPDSAVQAPSVVADTAAALRYDSSAVAARSAESSLQKFRNDPDFVYDRRASVNPTLWEQILDWLWRLFRTIVPEDNKTISTIWDYFVYILVGAALVYAIFRLTGTSFGGLFGKAGKRVVETEMLEENIHEIDFDRLIDEAVQQQQYRKALRLLYLRSLKELSDGDYIHWSPDKTNREYLAELRSGDLRRSFEQLTMLFEYIWYGDFPVDRTLFDRSRELFRNFSTMTVQHV